MIGSSEPSGAPRHSIRMLRRAVRVVLCAPDGAVLLMRGGDPAVPQVRYWFTVGGGLEADEDLIAAAIRETAEETGLELAPSQVTMTGHRETDEFGFGQYWVVQHQAFVVAPAPHRFTAAPLRLEPAEAATVDAWAWWTPDQLRAQRAGEPHDGPGRPGEGIYPVELPELLARWWPIRPDSARSAE
jgi:ADP-ribose pyrophosphatase YjhB (NUDIX family)